MQCLFLLRAGNACYCEVVSDHREHWRALLSSWVCRNAWEELCPRYRGLIKKAGDPPQPLFDHSETVHTSCIGHLNRIGGYPAIRPDLL